MPLNDKPEKMPLAGGIKQPTPDNSSEVMDEFAQRFVKELEFVKSSLEQQAPGQSEELLSELTQLPKDELVNTVFEISDGLKIKKIKSDGGPAINRLETFVRSVGNTAMLGVPEKAAGLFASLFVPTSAGEIIKDEAERTRLLEKAYPGVSITGMIASFVNPESAASKLFMGGAKGGITASKLTGKLAVQFAEKLGTDPKYAKMVGKLIDNSLTRATVAGAAGSAAFAAGKEAVTQGTDVAVGNKSVSDAVSEWGHKVLSQGEEGAQFGAMFGAGGMVATQAFRGGKVAFRQGAKLLGKDLRYQMDNLELVKEVMEATPELVIAESADKIAPILAREQAKLKAIQTAAKNEILQAVGTKQLELTQDLQGTAAELHNAVTGLRQSSEAQIAKASTKLNDTVGKAYAARNKAYGEKLNEIVGKTEAKVNLTSPLDLTDKILRSNGALDGKGKLLGGSDWAKANPELFSSLSDIWQRLGGEVRQAGGNVGITKNLQDTIQLQRQIGELAGFGKKPAYMERVFRDLYFEVKKSAESVAPELRPLNEAFSADRSKLDDFRSIVGRAEDNIAKKLRRSLDDNKNIFVREAIEGFAGVSEKAAEAVKEGSEISRRLGVVNGFKKDPKGVFNQLRQAYLNNDTITMSALERIAKENPALTPYLETAKKQANLITQIPKAGRAATDPEMGRLVSEAVPQASPAIARAQQAGTQAQELSSVLPQERLALEKKLGGNNFAAGELEQQVLRQAQEANPELAEPLKRAEAARVSQRLKTGKGLEKSSLEEFPVMGDVLFGLRKTATPVASRFLNIIARAKPKLRQNLIHEVWENLEGTQTFSKEQLGRLVQQVEPEAALVIYAQNGGADDLIRAADKAAVALGSDDEQKGNQNQPK